MCFWVEFKKHVWPTSWGRPQNVPSSGPSNHLPFFHKAPSRLLWCDLWSVSYSTALAITEAIRGTYQEKLYQETGLKSLRSRRLLRCMRYFYKLIKTQKPLYLFNLIPPKLNSLRHISTVMRCRNDYFKNSFILIYWENGIDFNSQFKLLPTI